MILCAALLFCVIATAALVIFAVWDSQQADELDAMAEHQEAMAALNPRGWA